MTKQAIIFTHLILSSLISGLVVYGVEAADEQVNAREFQALCLLYEMAKNPLQAPNTEDYLASTNNILREVEGMFYQTTENESEYETYAKTNTVKGRLQPSAGVRLANRKLGLALERLRAVKREYLERSKRLSHLYQEADGHLIKAIYGSSASSRSDSHIDANFFTKVGTGAGTPATARAEICGKNNVVAGAGKALLVDFACLCGGKTGTNQKPCYPTSSVKDWTDSGMPSNGKTAWTDATSQCHERGFLTTEANIASALSGFARELGVHGTTNGDNAVFGKLGQALSSGCDGGTSGLCVSYKAYLTQGTKSLKEIPWYKEFLEASQNIAQARSEEKIIRRTNETAASIAAVAEVAFQEALHAANQIEVNAPTHSQNQKKKKKKKKKKEENPNPNPFRQ